MAFTLLCALLLASTVFVATSKGSQYALWYVWLVATMLMPAWLYIEAGSMPILFRLVGGLAGLALVMGAKGPNRAGWGRFLLGDAIFFLHFASMTVTYLLQKDKGPHALFPFWLLPYLVGRVFLREPDDIGRLLKFLAPFLVLIAGLNALEAVTHFNPQATVLGKHMNDDSRFGMRRAQGAATHPIAYGMIQVTLFAWTLEAARRARLAGGQPWWRFLPWISAAGIIVTFSRGSWLCAIATTYIYFFFRRPQLRAVMLVVAVAAFLTAYFGQSTLMAVLEELRGTETIEEQFNNIKVIDGEEYFYNGDTHRFLLYKVYAPYMREAGSFGYGFVLQDEIHLSDEEQVFGSIDSHYVLHLLRFGNVGMALFLASAAISCFYYARVAWSGAGPLAGLSGALCGAMLSITVGLNTVYLSEELTSAWVFCAGLSGNLMMLHQRSRSAVASASEAPRPKGFGGSPVLT